MRAPHKTTGLLTVAVVGALSWTGVSAAQRPQRLVFERWQPPAAIAWDARSALALCRHTALQRHLHLLPDARLHRAAQALLPWAAAHAGEAVPSAEVANATQAQGVTDGERSALAIRAPTDELGLVIAREWATLLDENAGLNRIGLAVAPASQTGQSVVMLLASRRLVHLAPVLGHAPIGRVVPLSGTVLDPWVQSLTLGVAWDDDRTEQQAISLHQGHFLVPLAGPTTAKTAHVQLLVERGRGPEVAAEFPMAFGEAPAQPTPPPPALSSHQTLMTLLMAMREAHRLPSPMPSPALMRLAQDHANDMAAHHFFAHVSPREGNAAERLRRRGVAYRRVVENLALASDAEMAMADWHQSPSHLANLLDPKVDAVGIGSAPSPTLSGESLFVLVMATLSTREH